MYLLPHVLTLCMSLYVSVYECVWVFLLRALRIYSLGKFQVYDTVLLTTATMIL